MSIAVQGYPSTAYRQTPLAWPVKLFEPPKEKPAGVLLTFNWAVYFAVMNGATEIAVNVDLNSGGTSQGPPISKIVSCKIDNSNSLVPILIYFPDSQDVVSCPPQSIVTLPCTTNGSTCKVIATGLSAGNLPLTNIIFYNYFIPPSVDPVVQLVFPQLLGSPTIQRGNFLTPGFGPPALGDQGLGSSLLIDNTTPVAGRQKIMLPATTGFYYITALEVTVPWFRVGYAAIQRNVAGASIGFYDLTANTAIAPARVFNATDNASQTADVINAPILDVNAGNFRLDATHAYGIKFDSIAAAAGTIGSWNIEMFIWLSYTLNPN